MAMTTTTMTRTTAQPQPPSRCRHLAAPPKPPELPSHDRGLPLLSCWRPRLAATVASSTPQAVGATSGAYKPQARPWHASCGAYHPAAAAGGEGSTSKAVPRSHWHHHCEPLVEAPCPAVALALHPARTQRRAHSGHGRHRAAGVPGRGSRDQRSGAQRQSTKSGTPRSERARIGLGELATCWCLALVEPKQRSETVSAPPQTVHWLALPRLPNSKRLRKREGKLDASVVLKAISESYVSPRFISSSRTLHPHAVPWPLWPQTEAHLAGHPSAAPASTVHAPSRQI